jgi:serine/threonine protein kinase
MSFMHSRGFIHQDLKPSNILLNDKGRVLIGDFGASRNEYLDITPTSAGTVHYAAPEMFHEEVPLTRQVDIYSFGLILYEILVGNSFFGEDESPFSIIRQKRVGYVPSIGIGVVPSMGDLIRSCCELCPTSRPSFDDILDLFEQCDFTLVSGADGETVRDYVLGVRDWESSHTLDLPLPDSVYSLLPKV